MVGRLYQLEQTTTLALDVGRVERGDSWIPGIDSTTIGIKCSDGIIMGVEKTLLSKMLVPGTHRRIYAIDRHVGLVLSPSFLRLVERVVVSCCSLAV